MGELVDDDDRESLESSDIMMAGRWGLTVTEEASRAGAETEAEAEAEADEPEASAVPARGLAAITLRAGPGCRMVEKGREDKRE